MPAQQGATGVWRPSQSETMTAVERWFTAVNSQNADMMSGNLTSDTEQYLPFNVAGDLEWPNLCRASGHAQVMQYWTNVWSQVLELNLIIEEVTEVPGGTVVFVEATGTHSMADGSPYRNRYIFRLDAREGKIARVREYCNPINSAHAFKREIPGYTIVEG